jgi:acetyl-CoA acetyltransferase
MTSKIFVAGVGMTRFRKPSERVSYVELGPDAARAAIADANLAYSDVQQAYVGYCYGDSTCGQRVLYDLGLTGIPIVNVNNNCATGSSALFLARQAILSGQSDCVLALGFEEMGAGALGSKWSDRQQPLQEHVRVTREKFGDDPAPAAARWFGGAGREYQTLHGTRPETFAKVAEKARRHAAANPNAVFRDPLTLEQIMASPNVYEPLTRLQCCPPTSGAAAAILVSEAFARKRLSGPLVEVVAQSMTTDQPGAFDGSMIKMIGYDMAATAAQQVYANSGVGPDEVDVVEMHDCFTANELISYESLGLTPEGTAERFIWDGDNTFGGRVVTNPSGGLLSKGHPLGATGLAQCAELVWQLRGQAGDRQVKNARIGLQHNLGLGGACVVTLYKAE